MLEMDEPMFAEMGETAITCHVVVPDELPCISIGSILRQAYEPIIRKICSEQKNALNSKTRSRTW